MRQPRNLPQSGRATFKQSVENVKIQIRGRLGASFMFLCFVLFSIIGSNFQSVNAPNVGNFLPLFGIQKEPPPVLPTPRAAKRVNGFGGHIHPLILSCLWEEFQMAKAKQLPSGSWRVQVYAGKDASGKRQYLSFTALTKKEAEYNALQFQLHHKEVSRDSSNMTLDEAMQKYVSSKDGILSPSTIKGYDCIRRNNLRGLMDMKLNRLTPQLIQRAINEEAKPYIDEHGRRRTRTPKTIRNIHGLLSAVLAEYHPDLTLRTTLPQKKLKEQKVLEPDQIGTLLIAVEGTEMELPVLMGVWLCMRVSEITALTWDCIDFNQKTLTIKKALVRAKDGSWVEKATKTTISTRTLNLPDYIMSKLEAAKKQSISDRVGHALRGQYVRSAEDDPTEEWASRHPIPRFAAPKCQARDKNIFHINRNSKLPIGDSLGFLLLHVFCIHRPGR